MTNSEKFLEKYLEKFNVPPKYVPGKYENLISVMCVTPEEGIWSLCKCGHNI